MAVGVEMRALGGFFAVASLVFLLLSIFMPGVEWFGVDKLVLFSDQAEDSSLAVRSSFHFGYLWTHQKVETEIDVVVYEENEYGWCAGSTPGMPLPTQRALCGARRMMWACTAIYVLLGLINLILSCGTGGAVSSPRGQRSPPRFLTHALTVLAASQLLAGVALSWMWTGIKRGVEAYFTANYTEVNTLRMRVGWSWYLAGFSGLATTALFLLSLRLSCLAERRHRHNSTAAHPTKPSAPAAAADDDDSVSVTNHSLASDYIISGGLTPSTSLPSLNGAASSAYSSRASSRSTSPARIARVALVQQQQHNVNIGQGGSPSRRYPQRERHPPAEAQRAYHYS